MLRRYFLLQILLGWFLAISSKAGVFNSQKSNTAVNSNKVNSKIEPIGEPIIFYVATNGNDIWSGKREIPTKDKNDGPFATLKRAQAATREFKRQNKGLDRPIRVVLNGGVYSITEPIVFSPEDSGTQSFPISYEAAPQQQVTISGGKLIIGWQEKDLNGLRLWVANLKPTLSSKNFQHLWVNGTRRTRARYPNRGYLRIRSISNRKGKSVHDGDRQFNYKIKDLPHNINLEGSEAIVMSRWVESRLPVTKVDRRQHTLHFAKESVLKLAPNDLYYLENKFEFLDTPGEWYLDRQQSRLYYLPLPHEEITSAEVIAPVLNTLMTFTDKAKKRRTVDHLHFNNLTFAHTNAHLPPNGSGYSQNAWGVTSAVIANGMNNCRWRYCTWKNLGGYGIELFRRCQHNQIVGCTFFDLGAGGIKLGERKVYRPKTPPGQASHHNSITHNHIHDGGKFFPSAIGIGVASSHHNFIAYNHIHDFYYTAISVMGDWGFELTQAHNNLIEHNYIHHIGKLSYEHRPILSDMGGIYIVGNQPHTIIRHNKLHDINASRYGGWGIYLDEGSSKILVENNLVYRTSHGGFSQHYGKENVLRNNVFAFGKKTQLHRNKLDLRKSRAGDYVSFYFENNIVYWQEGNFIAGLKKDYQSHAVFKDNIYWKIGKSPALFGDLTWQKWYKSDRHSQIVDPLFVAPQRDDFRLLPNSPANY